MNLRFRYPVLLQELNDLQDLAGKFLENPHVLAQYEQDLRHLQHRDGLVTWQIPMGTELRTKKSGAYEVDGQGIEAYGLLSGVWDIRRVDQRTFEIADRSSCSVKIVRARDDVVVASWNFDVAAPNGPGIWLHSQVNWEKENLPVPRLPSLMITLADVLDFLLGELYQTDWPVALQRRRTAAHNGRLVAVLENMLGLLKGRGAIAGFNTLKASRPPVSLFLS